jgi:glycosyltransferase involved in cell wall biosynthesis
VSTDATVVIPARNVVGYLGQQLDALAAQDYDGTWEVVVADNGSTDGTADLVLRRAAGFPVPLRVADASGGRGINVARNAGAAAATSARLLFCDADDLVVNGWVRAMVTALDEYAIAGGPLDLTRLNSAWSLRARPIGAPNRINGFVFPIGANLACRTEVWTSIGGFDEQFNVGGWDEAEFCYRAQVHGYRAGEAPDAVVQYRLRDDRRSLVRQLWGVGRGEQVFRERYPEFLPARSVARDLVQLLRSVIGLSRRMVTVSPDRDFALGFCSVQAGRLYQAMHQWRGHR